MNNKKWMNQLLSRAPQMPRTNLFRHLLWKHLRTTPTAWLLSFMLSSSWCSCRFSFASIICLLPDPRPQLNSSRRSQTLSRAGCERMGIAILPHFRTLRGPCAAGDCNTRASWPGSLSPIASPIWTTWQNSTVPRIRQEERICHQSKKFTSLKELWASTSPSQAKVMQLALNYRSKILSCK